MTTPQPGDFFVQRTTTTNWRDQIMAHIIQWGTASNVNHAGIYIGTIEGTPTIVEARPCGAGYAPLTEYLGPNTKWSQGTTIPDQATRQRITHAAINLVGTPYSWIDCIAVAIAQKRLGHHLDATKPLDQQPWWYQRIARTDRLMCSQLVDYAYFQAGVHLFDYGRPFGLVSPADLDHVIDKGTTT